MSTTLAPLKPFRQHHPSSTDPLRPLTARRRGHARTTENTCGAELWTSDGLLSNLAAEWTATSSATAAGATTRRWGAACPALAGYAHPGQVLDDIDAGTTQDKDTKLGALLHLAHAGDTLAARTVLQAMLPKLRHIARYTDVSRDRQDDRGQITVTAFLAVLHRYPLDRHPTGIAGRLALDTLHVVTSDRRSPTTITEIVVDDVQNIADARGVDTTPDTTPNAATELDTVLAWACSTGVITVAELELLTAVYAPDPGQPGGHAAAAAARGMTPAAVRQRCSRATRSIRLAVLQAAGSNAE